MGTLGPAYTYMRMCTHAQDLHTNVRVPETMEDKFSALEFGFWNESHFI